MKLNVLLALTDKLKSDFKNMIGDYTKYYNKSQGDFLGEKRTYSPREGTIDEPTKRGVKKVVTTVDEKIDYFINNSKDYINYLFSQEKTNANGLSTADLIIEGINWGKFTSLELLRLKTLIESSDNGKLEGMLIEIPVRSDNEIWNKSENADYSVRSVFETPMVSGVAKTTNKEEYILDDPNLSRLKDGSNYSAVKSVRNVVQELGDYTLQKFSGEWSHVQRAGSLKRRSELLTAVIAALKVANEVEAVQSELTAQRIYGYIFYNQNK